MRRKVMRCDEMGRDGMFKVVIAEMIRVGWMNGPCLIHLLYLL